VPLSTARVLVPQADADAVAKKLAALPEVATTWTLDSFVPKDQDQKLPVIEAAEKALGPVLRASPRPAPSDEENVAALKRGAQALQDAAGQNSGAGADAARRLADALGKLAEADAAQRARVTDAFVRPLQLDLAAVAESLTAAPVRRASLPPNGAGDSVSANSSNHDKITLGHGAGDSVSANGSSHDKISLGNGAGDSVSATSSNHDKNSVSANSSNHDKISVGDGAHDSVSATSSRRQRRPIRHNNIRRGRQQLRHGV
jgi:hypothetical protein